VARSVALQMVETSIGAVVAGMFYETLIADTYIPLSVKLQRSKFHRATLHAFIHMCIRVHNPTQSGRTNTALLGCS
jgi:hypothetical protein